MQRNVRNWPSRIPFICCFTFSLVYEAHLLQIQILSLNLIISTRIIRFTNVFKRYGEGNKQPRTTGKCCFCQSRERLLSIEDANTIFRDVGKRLAYDVVTNLTRRHSSDPAVGISDFPHYNIHPTALCVNPQFPVWSLPAELVQM